jgi:signal transduction histidine kinase
MRMRTILLFSLLSVSCGLTVMSLVVVRSSLQRQIRESLLADLNHSVATFQNLQAQRREMLGREAALLADLPSLKALMTSDDPATIQDAGSEFWRVSGSDLFALVNSRGQIVAFYVKATIEEQAELTKHLQKIVSSQRNQRYLFGANRLFEISQHPLYFGSEDKGSQLGTVIIGYEIDKHVVQEVRQASSADVVFYVDKAIASSSLDAGHNEAFLQHINELSSVPVLGLDMQLKNEHYLATRLPLSDTGRMDIQLVVLKSFDAASRFSRHLNRLLAALGILVFLVGSALALYLSKMITKPLETLVAGARALGSGNFDYELGNEGVKELRELSDTFGYMRLQLRQTQQELIESARLATIGRMASAISHDLRHYLSAMYANAEFLGYSQTTEEERTELLYEVRLAVQGMTEMIDSLLIFGRTGQSFHPSHESLPSLIERTLALVRTHPDANGVRIVVGRMPQIESYIDPRNVERAIYNLLVNACQAAKRGSQNPVVTIELTEAIDQIQIWITDNGLGVPESIRGSLFEPFVSMGKESGIGLGLTVARRVAEDHGGYVSLESSDPGKTTFILCLGRRQSSSQDPHKQSPASGLRG